MVSDGPKVGDALLVGSLETGFDLIDPVTRQPIARGLQSIAAAIEAARRHHCNEIWQQHLYYRGRPLGDPFRLLRQFQ